jgi:hypothetical protein
MRFSQVLAYLGRSTHRGAIVSSRIQACDDDDVAFRWKTIETAAQSRHCA